jgi:hypothetical protein
MVQLFLLAGVATWWAIVRRAVQGQLVATCLLVYGGLAVGWPWPPPRFLVPILPLLVATAFTWLGHIVAPLLAGNSSRQRVVTITAAALVVVALVGHGRHLMATAARNRQAGYPFDVGFTRGGTTLPTWQQYLDLFAWIRANTRETDVLACGLDTMIFLYTGRQGFRPAVYRPESGYGVDVSPVGSAEEVRSLLERGRAQYLILVPGYSDREALARTVAEIRRSEPGFFQKVYGEMEDSFAVYRIQARVSARGPTGR